MNDKKGFVDYQECPSIKVGRLLLIDGFGVADHTGEPLRELNKRASLGILYNDPDGKPRKYLFGLITRKPPRLFLGVIWFNSGELGANEQRWVIEAYGRKYVELLKELAQEMISTFNVVILIRLVHEEPDIEAPESIW